MGGAGRFSGILGTGPEVAADAPRAQGDHMTSFHADVPWTQRVADRLGHYSAAMLMGAIGGAIAIGLFPPPGLFAISLPVILFAFVIVSWLLMRHHDRR